MESSKNTARVTVAWRRNSSAKTFSAKRKFAQFTGRRKLCWRVKVKTGFNCDCNVDDDDEAAMRCRSRATFASNISIMTQIHCMPHTAAENGQKISEARTQIDKLALRYASASN